MTLSCFILVRAAGAGVSARAPGTRGVRPTHPHTTGGASRAKVRVPTRGGGSPGVGEGVERAQAQAKKDKNAAFAGARPTLTLSSPSLTPSLSSSLSLSQTAQ